MTTSENPASAFFERPIPSAASSLGGPHRRLSASAAAAGAALALALVFAAGDAAAAQQPRALPFDQGWRLLGDAAAVEVHDGRRALRLGNGRAILQEADFGDGTIELEVQVSGLRSFVFVQLRLESPEEYEDFYLRPHKSTLPDALQYSPVFRDEGSWQLFHGPGGTAPAALPANEWVRLRIVLEGRRAALFVGDAQEPQLLVHRLARPPRRGGIGLRGFLPAGTAAPFAARFANVRISPSVGYDFPPAPIAETPRGLLTRWSVSPPLDEPEGAAVLALPESLAQGPWRTIEAEPNGVVLLGRHVERPEGSSSSTVLARVRLRAGADTVQRLDLGWSDAVTVFLNGAPFFHRDDSYSYDQPRRDGLIGLDQGTFFLPLRRGDNEVILALSDRFGGWGVMGRLEPAGGVEIVEP
ncbi:MAG TPA: hypothetical protein VNB06_09810 [Thermoanaerobaculia bacterium]|nr:hypothetical protein [Thermoanaerobaculia bacterium]